MVAWSVCIRQIPLVVAAVPVTGALPLLQPEQHLTVRGRLKYLHQHTYPGHHVHRLHIQRLQAKLKHRSSRTAFCNTLLQVLIEDAEFLMNQAAAGEVSWDDVRPQIAEKYEQAGLKDVAEFANAVR